MKNKINKLIIVLSILIAIFAYHGVAHADSDALISEEDMKLTEAYMEQADSCKNGKKVNSYLVMELVRKEEGIDKLRALLENDCIEGLRNSIGKTIADDWSVLISRGNLGLTDWYIKNCSDVSGVFHSWKCYFAAELLDWINFGVKEEVKELQEKLKLLVNSDWFTESMRDRIGLTEFDVALLKNDRDRVLAILDSIPMKENTPIDNAELLRFISSSTLMLQYLVSSHENYSGHLTGSHIKDPKLDTVVIISGPMGAAGSYVEVKHMIGIIEKLGLNWIIIGDKVRDIDNKYIEQVEGLFNELEGKLTFIINAHGVVDEGTHDHIMKFFAGGDVETHDLFKIIKWMSRDKAVDVILNSCYSGAAYIDAIEILPEGSRFLSTASESEGSYAVGKLMLNGVDHLMKFCKEFHSVFELFSLGTLYKMMIVDTNPQILVLPSNSGPTALGLNEASMNIGYILENQDIIIHYLENFLDEETLLSVKIFINQIETPLNEDFNIKDENLSRIIQYAVGMTQSDLCIFEEKEETGAIVDVDQERFRLKMRNSINKCEEIIGLSFKECLSREKAKAMSIDFAIAEVSS